MLTKLLHISFDTGQQYRFNDSDETFTWAGHTWVGWPFKTTGYERKADGSVPQPIVTLSNKDRLASSALLAYGEAASISYWYVDTSKTVQPPPATLRISHWTMTQDEVEITLLSPRDTGSRKWPLGRLANL